MKQYTVKSGQNIYDVAVMLYGTVEGIFDLLTNNRDLTIDSRLQPGNVLTYNEKFVINEDIVARLERNKIIVKHGEHICPINNAEATIKQHIYSYHPAEYDAIQTMTLEDQEKRWKQLTQPRFAILQEGKITSFDAWLKDSTHMFIDWGDGSDIDVLEAEDGELTVEHCYRGSGTHQITVYGDCSFYRLDFSNLNGIYYPLATIWADDFVTPIKNEELNKLIIK